MSAGKIACLLLYAALAAILVLMPGTPAAQVAFWLLLGLVIAHVVEMVVFYGELKRAGGSLAGHLVNVFLFGVFHMKEVRAGSAD